MALTIDQLMNKVREEINERIAKRNDLTEQLNAVRDADAVDTERESAIVDERAALDAEIKAQRERLDGLRAEAEADAAVARLQSEIRPTDTKRDASQTATVGVGSEPRTYRQDQDPKGTGFLSDMVARQLNDVSAAMRIDRHMQEERSLRGPQIERAVGTSAFAGIVVPQYLTDLYAPQAKAGRPFADVCRKHDLPATGMTATIGKITTGTGVDVQANEGDAASETNIDDTTMSVSIQTAAGQQTISRQAIERGVGVESATLEDLFRAYATSLNSKLLNQATNGLTNVATAISYTDGTPTAAELYPKLLAGPAAVEAALLDQAVGDTVAVMHSRRWYWLQSQLTSTWPMFGQPGVGIQQGGINYGEVYGSGFRGILPSGVPVIVDNNIATNLGAGTNEDEIYFISRSEAHLWEDPTAPMLIRTEATKAANLQVLLVVYGYFAYTFARRAHAQKINGTGLVTPTF